MNYYNGKGCLHILITALATEEPVREYKKEILNGRLALETPIPNLTKIGWILLLTRLQSPTIYVWDFFFPNGTVLHLKIKQK